MDDKLKAFWASNKIFFILLLPLIALYVARNWVIGLLVDSGNKVVSDASKQAEVLKTQETVENTQANQIKADADAQKAAEDAKPVDENWDQKK